MSRGSGTVSRAEGVDAQSVQDVQGALGGAAPESVNGDVQN